MKKTLAAIGASALGLTMVGAGAVAPAAADPTTEACTDISDQLSSTGTVTDNWYQDCVPQYGLGKAEFTIVADEDDPTAEFPAEFVTLDNVPDAAITTSSTIDSAALVSYYTGFADALVNPITVTDKIDGDATFQTYVANVVAPVTSIGLATDVPANVSGACTGDYGSAWVATFAPVDTTFSQEINGEDWSYKITATPLPTYFFGTISGGALLDGDWCVTDGAHTFTQATVPDTAPIGAYLFALVYHTPWNFTDQSSVYDLGTFGRVLPEPPPTPVVPAVLAETGVDTSPLVFAAGGFTAFGLALLGLTTFANRRRRAKV